MTGARTLRPLRSGPRELFLIVALAVTTLATVAPASAQVNVEALTREEAPLGRSGSLGGDLTVRTGNVDFVAVNLRARLYTVTESETRLIVGNGGIGFLDRSRFASSGLLHYRRTYTAVSEHFSPEWYLQANYDRPQLLDFRLVGGGGARTELKHGEWGEFGAGSMLMLEQEWLSLPDTALHPDATTEIRWSTFLSLRIVASETTVITSTTYIQPALGDFGDFRTLENLRLSTSITDELALTVSFDLRYDARPPDGIAALDTSLRTGVTFTY